MKNLRKIKLITKPTFQFHRFLFLYSILITTLSFIFAYGILATHSSLETLIQSCSSLIQIEPDFKNSIFNFSLLTFACYISTGLFVFFYSLYLSEKFSGPVTAILHQLKDIKNGNYEIRHELRKNDDLKEIFLEIQNLATSLKEKEASRQSRK